MAHEKARAARQLHHDELMKLPNVLGTGAGNKITGRVDTGQEAVVVYVQRKVRTGALSTEALVKPVLTLRDGQEVATDVVDVGIVRALADVNQTRVRPIVGGVSIGPTNFSLAGTIGLPLLLKGDKRYVLTNRHVIGCDWLNPAPDMVPPGSDWDLKYNIRIGSRVCQPSSGDFDGDYEQNWIGTVAAWSDISPNKTNLMDAAILELTVDANSEILGIGGYRQRAEPSIGMPVQKSGRTSGVTDGTVTGLDVTIKVEYERLGVLTFANQLALSPMLRPGDSGSAIVEKGSGAIVGLGFSGTDTISIANPIGMVLSYFGLSLPTGPLHTPVAEALRSITDVLVRVWSYEGTAGWRLYDPSYPHSEYDLAALEAGRGYWINVSKDAVLTYHGRTKQLTQGWNLIGWEG